MIRNMTIIALFSTSCMMGTPLIASEYMAADANDDGSDGAIIVTGTKESPYVPKASSSGSKTDTPLRDVPAAIVVIPAAVLQDQGAQNLNQALGNASAVAPVYGGGYGAFDNYVIRGLRMKFLRDGVSDGPSFIGYYRLLADTQSIEVLKGPGSALYGRAEPGGSVNIVTKAPLGEFRAEAELRAGSDDTYQGTLDIGGGISDRVKTRLIGTYYRTDGIRGLSRKVYEISPTISLDWGGGQTLTLDYDHRFNDAVVDNYGIPFSVNRTFATNDRSARFYSAFNRVKQTINRVTLRNEGPIADNLTARVALVYDARNIDIRRNAGGNAINAVGVMTGRNGRTQTDDASYFTGQAELVWKPKTGAINHTVLFGIEYEGTKDDSTRFTYALPNLTVGAPVVDSLSALIPVRTFDKRVAADTMSIYGQEQLDIADRIKLRAGIRMDNVKFSDIGIGNAVSGPTPAGGVQRRIADTQTLWSGQVGAVYHPIEPLSIYAGYSKGKFLNIQTESVNLTQVPESSSQIEAGIKAELFAGKLNANVAIFKTKRDNYYVTLIAGGDPAPVGRQTTKGIEFDVIGTPFAGFTITANYAFLKPVNTSNELSSVTGIAVNQPLAGKTLASTPKQSGAIWANYILQSGTFEGLGFGLGALHKGATFGDSLELLKVPGYTTLRAALSYRMKNADIQINVDNLTNKEYFYVPTFIGAQPGQGRNIQLSLRVRM